LSKKDRICRNIIDWGILGLIVFTPLPAASVYKWSVLLIQLIVLIMFGAYLIMREKPKINPNLQRSLKWPKIFFVGFGALIILQLMPLPALVVKLLSPNVYEFKQQYFADFQNVKFISLSLIPSHTLNKGLELLPYFLLGFLIIKTITQKKQIVRLLSFLLAMGIFQAVYGLFELNNQNPRILFYKKIHLLDSATGTFVNRNHFSGYLEMIIPLAIGLIIARLNLFSIAGLKWRELLALISEKKVTTVLLTTFGVIVMCLAVLFSKSRSGIFVVFFSFLLFFGLIIIYLDIGRNQKKWIETFLITVFLVISVIALQLGISSSMERFAMDDLLQEGRPVYWANTLAIFTAYPVLGAGLGTFTSIYPDWEVSGVSIRLFHAHNDYLEYLAEVGVIGMILLLGGVLALGVNSFLTWRSRRNPEVKGLALGGLVAVICILIHSFTDFNLHIPGNMLLFSVVLSLTAVIAYYRVETSPDRT